MAFLGGLFSRPTKEEQDAVDWAAANQRKSGSEVGFAKVKGTGNLVSYSEDFGAIVHGKYMMPVRPSEKTKRRR